MDTGCHLLQVLLRASYSAHVPDVSRCAVTLKHHRINNEMMATSRVQIVCVVFELAWDLRNANLPRGGVLKKHSNPIWRWQRPHIELCSYLQKRRHQVLIRPRTSYKAPRIEQSTWATVMSGLELAALNANSLKLSVKHSASLFFFLGGGLYWM